MNPETDIYLQLLRKFDAEIKESRNTFSNQTENESAHQLSLLSNALVRPLAVLRCFGNNPLFFTSVKHRNTQVTYRRYTYKRTSWLTIFSSVGPLFYISGFTVLAYRLFHGDYQASKVPGSGLKAKHSTNDADGLMKAFLVSFFLACGGGATCSFWKTAQLSEYLNSWEKIVFKFGTVFHGRCIDFRYADRISKFLLVYSTLMCSIYMIWSVVLYKTCILNLNNNCTWIEREQSLMLVGFGCASILNTTFEQFKLGMCLQVTWHTYSQINEAIIESKKYFSQGKYNLREFFTLIHALRAQGKTLRQIFGSSQLLVLFFLFSLTIIGWMMLIQFSSGNITISLVLIVISIGAVQFSRLALTARLANYVLTEERKLMNEISDIQPCSMKGQIEIQMFVNLLTKRHTEFRLHNVITIQYSLFLSLLSNSTTYIIAILQLLDVSSSDNSSATDTILVSSSSVYYNGTQ